MNRRSFLTSLLALITVPRQVSNPGKAEPIFSGTFGPTGTWLGIQRSPNPQFVSCWMHPSQKEAYDALANLAIANPSQNMRIDNISVPESY